MSDTLNDFVSGEIRANLARKRLSQADLAKGIGKGQATIARRLSGDIPFTLTELEAIAAFLQIPLESLLPAGAVA